MKGQDHTQYKLLIKERYDGEKFCDIGSIFVLASLYRDRHFKSRFIIVISYEDVFIHILRNIIYLPREPFIELDCDGLAPRARKVDRACGVDED